MLAGNLDGWLPHFQSLEQKVSDAVEVAWPRCVAPLLSLKNDMTLEDRITDHLVQSLIRARSLPGRLVSQYVLLVEDDSGNVSLSSKIDFVLTVGDDEDVYLACECKRLNVPYEKGTKGLFGEYVEEGLMRFVSGQYSNGLPVAMMLGYVMDGRVDHARNGIKRAMNARRSSIRLNSERDVSVTKGKPPRFFTNHTSAPGHEIEVCHSLLAWP